MDIFNNKLNKALVLLEANAKSKTLSNLDQITVELGIPTTLIGGMAVAAHGYARFTNDIDILITQNDAKILAQKLIGFGWVDIGNNKLESPKHNIILNLCAEGVKAGKISFPPPEKSQPGISIASLPLLISLKLKANRHKDRSDIIELIKSNSIDKQYISSQVLPLLSGLDKQLAMLLLQKALAELDGE